MKNTSLTIIVLTMLGCACSEIVEESGDKFYPPKAKEEKPTAVFDEVTVKAWRGLKKEMSFNNINMNGNNGTVFHYGVSIKYDYKNNKLILHKIRVRFPASTFGWKENDVLNLVKDKLVKHGVKL